VLFQRRRAKSRTRPPACKHAFEKTVLGNLCRDSRVFRARQANMVFWCRPGSPSTPSCVHNAFSTICRYRSTRCSRGFPVPRGCFRKPIWKRIYSKNFQRKRGSGDGVPGRCLAPSRRFRIDRFPYGKFSNHNARRTSCGTREMSGHHRLHGFERKNAPRGSREAPRGSMAHGCHVHFRNVWSEINREYSGRI
jgi:hypothetical protein